MAENRYVVTLCLERRRCACITGVGRLEVYTEISRAFPLARVSSLTKKK